MNKPESTPARTLEASELGFGALVASVESGLQRVAQAITLDRGAASDIAQETLLIAFEDWDRVRRLDRPDLWVRRVAINQAIDWRRREHGRAKLFRRLAQDRVLRSNLGDTVAFWEAVGQLPPRQATVVTLRTAGELSVAEIAETLEIAEGTVRATLHAARAPLRRKLIDRYGARDRRER